MASDEKDSESSGSELATGKRTPQEMSFMEACIQETINEHEQSQIYLINGIKLEGYALAVDAESILYQQDDTRRPFAINRSAVASFLPKGATITGQDKRRPLAR